MAAPANQGTEAPKAGPSLLVFLMAMMLLTLIAVGGGGFVGLQLVGQIRTGLEERPKPKPEEKPAEARYAGDASLRDLPPIVTNLAPPSEAMIRLQATIVFESRTLPHPETVVAEVTEDIVTYLRTVSVPQIEGASGLQHLRDDLNERASIRSDKKVREVIIQSLVVQ